MSCPFKAACYVLLAGLDDTTQLTITHCNIVELSLTAMAVPFVPHSLCAQDTRALHAAVIDCTIRKRASASAAGLPTAHMCYHIRHLLLCAGTSVGRVHHSSAWMLAHTCAGLRLHRQCIEQQQGMLMTLTSDCV